MGAFQTVVRWTLARLFVGTTVLDRLSRTILGVAAPTTMSSDLFAQHEAGTAAGIAGVAANIGSLIFTLAPGAFLDKVGYQPFSFSSASSLSSLRCCFRP